MKKCFSKCLAAFMTMLIIGGLFGIVSFAAPSYEGSGTVSSPYLVQTAEQLDGIRNNLSAHYKLSNTIDLSSFGEFTPIGILSRPFSGSFTCDMNSDGTPKYIIKNLKVYNHAGEKFKHTYNAVQSDYAKDNSKWETALFGATSGASLKGIYILNADVTSTVIGQEDMNNDYSLNYGQKDEQGTAVLIGIAKSTTVQNCFASGTVTSASNGNGGLVGQALGGCTFKNCGAEVTVNTTGIYYSGGFVGKMETGTVTGCYATGNVTLTKSFGAKSYHMAGFICRANDVTVSNCYSTGSVTHGQSFILSANTGTQTNKCFATGSVTETKNDWSEMTASSCFVLNSGFQPDFESKDKAGILSAFSGASGWNTSGTELPTLTGVGKVSADAYNPETVTKTPSSSDSKNESSATETTALTVDEVVELASKLPDDPETVDISMKDAIKKAKKALDSLADSDYTKVPTEAVAKITNCYEALCPLLLSDIADRIEKLPDVKKLTAKDADKVNEIYDDFEFLPSEMQEILASNLKTKLEKAKKAIEELSGGSDVMVVRPDHNQSETILIIVLSVIAVLMLAAEVFIVITFLKKMKSGKKSSENIISFEESKKSV